MNYRDFDVLKSITRIEGELVNETPLRIGVGREPPLGAPVDLAVYRVNGVPCIPGSSLKGIFRSLTESLAISIGISVHSPWDSKKIEQEAKDLDFCPVCGIFGSTEIASHIRVYDAYPKDRASHTFIKTGISIDREFGSVRPGALFMEECVVPNTIWFFKMDVLNIIFLPEPDKEDIRARLLKDLFDYLINLGMSVGARKSVGEGFIKLRKAKWYVYSLKEGKLAILFEGVLQ
ncbi:MAG: RAMP superfamily CRISPR-associated protein [Thermoproteota archaeon]